MADKVIIEAEVKSNVGAVGKDAASAAGEFRVMGVSLNGVKRGFTAMAVSAKASFATIKAGMISTGLGAFVVAVGTLISYFTNTKRGADKLSQAFTAMGAVVDVLKDRISKVGEAISFLFSGEFRKAGEALKGTFAGITAEVALEVAAMVNLKKRTQELRDADMEFMVQKAKTRQEIEKARLIAEDETKSAAERLTNLKKALELEAETTIKEIALAKERMEIQKQEMALSENSAEDEEELARLKTDIIEKETASVKMRRRVVTEVNALEREIRAEEKARHKEKLDEIAAEKKELDDLYKLQIKQADDWEKKVIASQEAVAKSKQDTARAIGSAIGALGGLMNEGSAAAKTAALTEIAINTGVGFVQGLNIAQKSAAAAGPGAALAFPLFYATQVAAVLGAAAQAKQILGAGGGAAAGGGASPSAVAPTTPAPQMMSGAFELTGAVEPEPLKAFVITDEMTSSQNQLANIRRRATI
jgi:hypothetical protein|tara:strand:- start:170 stop:1594 length:1425 start_codon:yes stop_codon:yes gene_type:complete